MCKRCEAVRKLSEDASYVCKQCDVVSNLSSKAEVRQGMVRLHEHVWVDPIEIIAIYGDGRPDGDAVVQLTSGRSVIVPDSTATEVMDTLDSVRDAIQEAHESRNS